MSRLRQIIKEEIRRVLSESDKKSNLKKGDRIRIHKHGNVYIPGKITDRRGSKITYDSDNGDVSGTIDIHAKDFEDKIQC